MGLGSNTLLSICTRMYVARATVSISMFALKPAHNLYPLRIRIVIENREDVWLTVAYIPIVRPKKEPGADERARKRRSAILQRVLYLVFQSTIADSHIGVNVHFVGRELPCFPRLLLYICDLPEEKGLLCLKGGKTARPC